mgnify:CR=1 FL=1|tara:strand:- start:2091 stop:2372 length:282 start_codon:yes stop_codon:yes gene_type:complete
MKFTNLIYSNAENTAISAECDGQFVSVPVVVGNSHYDEIVEQGLDIAAYVAPVPTWEDERRAGYGTWQDQLDKMFHGTWKDHVAAVKAAHPKP